jgi:hypothetical protein
MFKYIKIILLVLNFNNFKCAKSFIKPYIFNNKNLRLNINILALKTYNNSYNKPNLKLQKYHDTVNYLNTLNKNSTSKNITYISNNINTGKKYTDEYLNQLNHKYKLKIDNHKISNRNIIHKINIHDLIMFNNFIDAIYYNSLNYKSEDNIIIEFKNNTRKVFYYDNIDLNITKIIDINQNIDLININNYPYYMLNTPFAFLICEQK